MKEQHKAEFTSICQKARKLWLSSSDEKNLYEVEKLYRQALEVIIIHPDNDKDNKNNENDKGLMDDTIDCDSNDANGDDDLNTAGANKRQRLGITGDNNQKTMQKKEMATEIKSNQGVGQEKSSHHDQNNDNDESINFISNNPRDFCPGIEQFILLLLQSGRSKEAEPYLKALGYTCRLSCNILNYQFFASPQQQPQPPQKQQQRRRRRKPTSLPCCQMWNHFLTPHELCHLQSIFSNRQATYWTNHDYQIEPPSPYFSYIIPLLKQHNTSNSSSENIDLKQEFGFLGHLIEKCRTLILNQQQQKDDNCISDLSHATAVEMWAHNRPHASGHQLHFDSDNEGRGGIVRHPICTVILYLSRGVDRQHDDGGGPTLITSQTLSHAKLATRGWLAHVEEGRIVVMNGAYLHGVIPGKGHSNKNKNNNNDDDSTNEMNNNKKTKQSSHDEKEENNGRVTLMLAFWKSIRIRHEGGAAQPFPTAGTTDWANRLTCQTWNNNNEEAEIEPQKVEPIVLDHVYETIQGEPWSWQMGFPEYHQVYQGF